MPRSTHSADTLSWRVMKPNAPVVGRSPAQAPAALKFLSMPVRATAPAAAHEAPADGPFGTVFQAAGALLIEVPLASELAGPLPTLGFVARHQA
jgi:hypothetical protein